MIPGEYILKKEDIIVNEGRETVEILVKNTDKRPVQVGSHFHFFEVNRALEFDRKKAFGKKLNVPSGMAVRFEPGEEKKVSLVSIGGKNLVYGLNGLVKGSTLTGEKVVEAVSRAKARDFKEV